MAYKQDGSPHREAVLVEKSIPKYKERFEFYYKKPIMNITHVGGTTTTIDFEIKFFDGSILKKSLKKKKILKNGSFDYINTSDIDKLLIPNSLMAYKKYRGTNNSLAKRYLIDSIGEDLQKMSSKTITDIVKNKIIKKYDEIGLDIIETTTDKLYIDIIPLFFETIKNGGYLNIKQVDKKQMSYMLNLYNKEGNLIPDCGLRIRLHLNNGWTKWYRGESSNLVIKIQQDKVDKLFKI